MAEGLGWTLPAPGSIVASQLAQLGRICVSKYFSTEKHAMQWGRCGRGTGMDTACTRQHRGQPAGAAGPHASGARHGPCHCSGASVLTCCWLPEMHRPVLAVCCSGDLVAVHLCTARLAYSSSRADSATEGTQLIAAAFACSCWPERCPGYTVRCCGCQRMTWKPPSTCWSRSPASGPARALCLSPRQR